MSILDSPEAIARGDPSRTLDVLGSLGDQIRGAASAVDAADLPRVRSSSVVVCGMGGSGVGAELAAAAAARSGSVPVVAHHTYGAPAFTGPDTLVIASSYSGETEETLDAFRAGRDAGASGVAVTSGGTLAREASAAGWTVVPVEPVPMPRYAVGWISTAPMAVLERLGLLRLSARWRDVLPGALDARAAQWGAAAPTQDNVAKALAHELVGSLPVIWGGDGASGPAAVRWKNDICENAKMLAHAAVLPEADHNENVGLAPEGREGRPPGRRVLVCLREPDEHPRVAARFAETTRDVAGDFDLVWEATARGEDVLERFCDLALLGGFVSTYLAVLRGVDPAPVPSIDRLKRALAR